MKVGKNVFSLWHYLIPRCQTHIQECIKFPKTGGVGQKVTHSYTLFSIVPKSWEELAYHIVQSCNTEDCFGIPSKNYIIAWTKLENWRSTILYYTAYGV